MSIVKNKINQFILKILPHRLWVQSGFLLIWLDPLALRMHTACSPVLHCYACPLATFACPIGVIAQFSAIHVFPFAAIGLLLFIGAFIGSIICGWVCPFGLLQDLAAKVPVKKFAIPNWAGYLRYAVLAALVIIIPFLFGENHPLFFCRICPAGGLEKAVPDVLTAAFTGQTIPWPNPLKLSIIIVFVLAIFVTVRPWCKVICPLGVIFGFFNRFSILTMAFDKQSCKQCRQCHTMCDYGILPDKQQNSDNCIRCMECTKCKFDSLAAANIFQQDQSM